ncbi:MAG: hypothetical protein N0C84_01055 [Candidatus Thiodiazotropha taylori]|uniref:Uncharacterized protein n=1 Tax=Candidatus Thiodiazotropha taylori TaxID=2792791 RepID=A0A9E4KAU3_9GAMM|nr:hypothetical protein [Candidatus Thiodiazotropha taylori]MCW4255034.1 hypothetical protein [Candidatus Thiodiazotropha taylori]
MPRDLVSFSDYRSPAAIAEDLMINGIVFQEDVYTNLTDMEILSMGINEAVLECLPSRKPKPLNVSEINEYKKRTITDSDIARAKKLARRIF